MTVLNKVSKNKLNTQLSPKPKFKAASLMVGIITMAAASSLLVACGGGEHGDDHEVYAVDRVEEAAEMARANAPEPVDMKFDQTEEATMASVETATATTAATEGQSMSTEAAETNTDTNTADASAKTDAASTTDNADVIEVPIVPETKPLLTGDTAQAADAAAAAVQKAN